MGSEVRPFTENCPINEQTADGVRVGRCWTKLVGNYCERHGDVSKAVARYIETGRMTLERDHERKVGDEST